MLRPRPGSMAAAVIVFLEPYGLRCHLVAYARFHQLFTPRVCAVGAEQLNQLRALGAGRSKAAPIVETLAGLQHLNFRG